MTDLEWRCAAAQTFVDGQITQIDSYWQSSVLGANIYELIDEYDLWADAFGGNARKIKEKWRSMLALRTGQGGAGRMAKAKFGNLLGKNEFKLGTDLFAALKQDVVMPLQQMFKQSSLTINFKAGGWFKDQAGFDSYITMWDRKITGAALTADADPQNPAHIRAKADRWALYGQFSDGKQRVAATGMQLPHVKRTGGMTSPEAWDYSTGKPGKPRAQPSPGSPADNQLFAALNYGQREHGASNRYGQSFFELSDDYKTQAIYFAMDTFTPVYDGSALGRPKTQRSKLYQVSAGAFGGAILLAIKSQNPTKNNNAEALLKALLSSARGVGMPKPDTDQEYLLIEAHIFQKLPMTPRCIKCVNVARSECPQGSAMEGNANAFAARTQIPLKYVS